MVRICGSVHWAPAYTGQNGAFSVVFIGFFLQRCCLSLCCHHHSNTMKHSPAGCFARPLAEVLLGHEVANKELYSGEKQRLL